MASSLKMNPAVGKWALASLVMGVILGLLAQALGLTAVRVFSTYVEPLGTIWLRALQMMVLPLVVTQLLSALIRAGEGKAVARTAGRASGLSLGYMVGGGVLVALMAPPFLETFFLPPDLSLLLNPANVPEAARMAAERGPGDGGGWLVGLVPSNVFQALAEGSLLQVIVFVFFLGLALSRLPEEERAPVGRLLRSLADAVMIMVGWVLLGTPVGVFSLGLSFAIAQGLGLLSLLAMYVLTLSGLFLVFTAMLYPITFLSGKVSPSAFFRALIPAQAIAMGTQSSMASLPALVEGGREHLRLRNRCSGFVLPFCVSTFRYNSPVSEGFNLLFLAFVFGVDLTAGDIGLFLLGILILSFSIAGVPRGGGAFQSLPFYLAVGIPIEGVVLIEMVKTVPDVFFTLYNVTANMSVAAILSGRRRESGSEVLPAGVIRKIPAQAPLQVLGGIPTVRRRRRRTESVANGPARSPAEAPVPPSDPPLP